MIIPQIIIAGLSKMPIESASIVHRVLRSVEEKFSEMDIKILVAHENFSNEELMAWVQEISTPIDFFLNIQLGESLQVQFVHQSEEEMASHLAYGSALRLGVSPDPSLISLCTESPETHGYASLPLHVWNIIFPVHLSEKQLALNVMACVTDIYTTKHSLLQDSHLWPFRDVSSSHFAFEAIKKAKAKKIITGYKGDIFYPNGAITRGEVLYMLDKLGMLEE